MDPAQRLLAIGVALIFGGVWILRQTMIRPPTSVIGYYGGILTGLIISLIGLGLSLWAMSTGVF